MTIYYSKTTGGFYDDAIHTEGQIPSDRVEISAEDHAALFAAQHSGKTIVAGKKGRPVAVDPPATTADQLLAALRVERDRLLASCDWTQMPDTPLSADQRSAWAAYRQALRDLPGATTGPPNPAWPTPPA